MNRDEVLKVISDERDYQIKMTNETTRPDMNPEMSMGDLLSAMEVNLSKAKQAWYTDSYPYTNTLDYVRKVAGLAVQAGERYDMPNRE